MSESRGLTLIEVVAALAILGVLLTGLLLTQQRATRQWTMASQRLVAVEATDRLLRNWTRDAAGPPLYGSGPVADHAEWRWRTATRSDDALATVGVQVLSVEVTDERDQVLTSVELLVPIDEPPAPASEIEADPE